MPASTTPAPLKILSNLSTSPKPAFIARFMLPRLGGRRRGLPTAGLPHPSVQPGQVLVVLVGRQVACVVNLAPRRIGPFVSEVLTLGFPDDQSRVVLVVPERPVPNGARLF